MFFYRAQINRWSGMKLGSLLNEHAPLRAMSFVVALQPRWKKEEAIITSVGVNSGCFCSKMLFIAFPVCLLLISLSCLLTYLLTRWNVFAKKDQENNRSQFLLLLLLKVKEQIMVCPPDRTFHNLSASKTTKKQIFIKFRSVDEALKLLNVRQGRSFRRSTS